MPITEPESGAAGLSGGCMCGAVRFYLADVPRDAAWCHCRNCQLNSGSPAMAFAAIAPADYVVECGHDAIRSVRSSDRVERLFCGMCGTPLLTRDVDGSGDYHFNLPTLDEPSVVTPQFHIYYDSHIAWAPAADTLPRHARSGRKD